MFCALQQWKNAAVYVTVHAIEAGCLCIVNNKDEVK